MLEFLASEINKTRKGIEGEGIQIKKEEIKLSLFQDDMIFYVENPKEFSENILELLSTSNLQESKWTYKNQLYF